MWAWQLSVDKNRQEATQAPSKMDENLKYTVCTVRRRVFQIPLFKGFPNIGHIPPPPFRDTHGAQMRQQGLRPRKMHKVGRIGTIPERYAR